MLEEKAAITGLLLHAKKKFADLSIDCIEEWLVNVAKTVCIEAKLYMI